MNTIMAVVEEATPKSLRGLHNSFLAILIVEKTRFLLATPHRLRSVA